MFHSLFNVSIFANATHVGMTLQGRKFPANDLKKLTKDVQDVTDSYVKKIDEVYKLKEKEVLED